MCTLVGTSTNLLVSGVLENVERPGIGMFEMSMPGILLACVGMLYIGLIGRHFLPKVHSLAAQPGAADLLEEVTRSGGVHPPISGRTVPAAEPLDGKAGRAAADALGEGRCRLDLRVRLPPEPRRHHPVHSGRIRNA